MQEAAMLRPDSNTIMHILLVMVLNDAFTPVVFMLKYMLTYTVSYRRIRFAVADFWQLFDLFAVSRGGFKSL